MAKRWKKQEVTYLKRYAERRMLSELAARFRTSPEEVEEKLKYLGLASKDGRGSVPRQVDPLLPVYERGLKALQRKKWAQAAPLFSRVVAESADAEMVGRARRFLKLCRQQTKRKPAAKATDPFLRAVYERNRGNLDEALDICAKGGRQSKDERFAYLAASVFSLLEDHDKAAKYLARAIELNPKNRVHAFHDADFEALRNHPEHRQLFF